MDNERDTMRILDTTGNLLFEGDAATTRDCLLSALMTGVSLRYSNLRYSNLSYSDLSGSNLSYSDLSGSNLSCSNLSYSDLSCSNLSGSNLRGSNLSGSNLRGSNLSGSDLSGSDLSGSNLSYSNLSGVPVLDGGLDSRGYRYFLTAFNGVVGVQAGCRKFSLAEARAHWHGQHADEPRNLLDREAIQIVEQMLARAALRGWAVKDETQTEKVTK